MRRINLQARDFPINYVTLARLHSEARTLQERTQLYLNVRTGDDLAKTFAAFGEITEAGKILLSTIESLPKPSQAGGTN